MPQISSIFTRNTKKHIALGHKCYPDVTFRNKKHCPLIEKKTLKEQNYS